MQRTNIFLTEEQQRRLDRRAEEEGVTKSSLIRQILDEALAIRQTSASTDSVIRATSGIWADRDEAELSDLLRWRHEAPLERLSQ
jgi:metal-responsive CopG/Arc/MetJ family transcriptional regulator